MPGIVSRFVEAIPPDVVEERRTSGVFGGNWFSKPAKMQPMSHAPVASDDSPEMQSQDAPRYIKGERVLHRSFGSGVIRGLTGTGRDLKVTVEFDDEEVATKQLLVRYAGLQRDWDPA